MPFNLQDFATKLKRRRADLDLRLETLAQETGISAESLRAYEEASRHPTGDEILILADFFRCDYRYFVAEDAPDPFKNSSILFRAYSEDLSGEDRRAVNEFLFLCDCEEFLLQQLRIQRSTFSIKPHGDHYKGHGHQAADALRRSLSYTENEVPHDVFKDFRQIGLHVFRRSLHNEKISGLFIQHLNTGCCILVNYDEDLYRQRFTAAHECGHAILDTDQEYGISFGTNGNDLREVRANAFASHYLFPPEFLKKLSPPSGWNEEQIVDWANKMKVSTWALSIALNESGLIDASAAAHMQRVKVPRELKTDPELSPDLSPNRRRLKLELLERGLSDYYVGLCFDAHHRGLISTGRLAEMLLADEPLLQEVAQLYGRSLAYGD